MYQRDRLLPHEVVVASCVWRLASATDRVGRSISALESVRAEVSGWLRARHTDDRYARFAGHFDVLETVLTRMLDAVEGELTGIEADGSTSGRIYERCRAAERRISLVQRVFGWYAAKYEQRADARLAPALQAADEVVRSCWSEPFAAVGQIPPTGPLAYLDARFDAMATPRVSVPSDLRAPADAVVGEFVRQLPIPVVALPSISADDPWWLVLAAHETGHHVHRDLAAELEQATGEALYAAVCDPPGAEDLALDWQAWGLEAFADAFAVLMVGGAATWAVEELQHATPARLVLEPRPGDRYPPPAVRTALLGELARCAAVPDPGPGAEEMCRWLDSVPADDLPRSARVAVARHLAVTRAAAAALLQLSVQGVALPALCGWTPTLFTAGGAADRWAHALVSARPVITGREARQAARVGVAGGVAAYRTATGSAEMLTRLRGNLTRELARCGPPGRLAAAPPTKMDELADQLAARLLAIEDEEV